MCSYHAWRWNGDAELTHVPQAHSETELERIKSNPKSKCSSYPTTVKHGLLWVWPNNGSDALIESALTPVQDMSLDGWDVYKSRVVEGEWNFRCIPYGWDYFVENLVDPAHVPVSHHSTVSNRYEEPRPLLIKTTKQVNKNGFSCEFAMESDQDTKEPHKFYDKFAAPGQIEIMTPLGDDGARHVVETYVSPAAPGYCNVMARQSIIKSIDGRVPPSGRQTRDSQIKARIAHTSLCIPISNSHV